VTPRRRTRSLIFLGWAVLAASSLAFPETGANGSLEGVVRDSRGLVLPGVTVSLSGPEIIGHRVATTDEGGIYRFPALAPGTYTVTFGLLGYQPLRRDGIVITTGPAVALELALAPAGLTEEPTEPSGPPVVDPKTTGAAATFDARQLDDVPSAASMWAVLDTSPGIQMRGYDVGGSHKGQQTQYEAFGIRGQNRIVHDGVNTTEGTGQAGGYFDYYAIDEIRVSGRGADVEMSTPGAQVVATWKSGHNKFSGSVQGAYENADLVRNNIDDGLKERGGTSAETREFYEYHLDLGGPIVKDRVWFYVAHNRFFLDRAVSGQDPSVATEIADVDMLTGKITARPTSRDQLSASGHWSFKQQPNRGLSLTVPPDSVLAQESRTGFFKVDWQRTWSDRLSSSVMVGYFGYEWDMVPRVDPGALPPRLDTATSMQSGAGWAPFTSSRWKPQSTGQINYHLPTAGAGSHDFKLGWDWQIDRNGPAWSDASGAIRYLDNSAYGRPTSIPDVFVDRILFANVPNQGQADHNRHTDFFVQDVWRMNGRLSLTLGLRAGRQDVYYTDNENNPLQSDIFAPTSAPGSDVIDRWNVAPRLGVAIDLTGRGKSVFKAYVGRFYANVGSGLEEANPGGRSQRVYEFLDLNGNGLYDGTQELGKVLEATGGSVTQVDPDFALAYSDELSLSLEQELAADLGIRFSFVHKRYRNWWDTGVNVAQALNLTNHVTATCTGCPLGLEGSNINLSTIPDDQTILVDPRIMNVPLLPTTGGENTDMSFTTWQVELIRRFRDNFFLNASFDKQSRDELRGPDASTSPLVADPLEQGWFQNHSLDVANRQETRYWNAKLLARYLAPHEFGLAVSVRYQSGFPWAPVHRLLVPNVGTKAILLTDMNENRSEDVVVADLRVDKSWRFGGHYRVTAMADVYNLLNANPPTNFIVNTGSRFDDVIEWLPGTTLKLGLRLQF
jgi:outer membrane receptor protein involved in Fe transport